MTKYSKILRKLSPSTPRRKSTSPTTTNKTTLKEKFEDIPEVPRANQKKETPKTSSPRLTF